jgi:hypothetical protein
MYEQHIALSSPPDTTRIWRFMDLGKFISALHTSSLFFCRADLLRDPYECMPNEKMIEDYAKRVPRADNRFLEDMRQMTVANRLWTYINSWHMNEFESAAMWELYLKNQEGIAIETDFARLRDCFSAEESHLVFIGAVKYIDYATEIIPWENSFYAALHKRKSFEHERELRAIVWLALEVKPNKPGQKTSVLDSSKNPHGVQVKINLGTLIKTIFVSPTAEPWYVDIVSAMLEKFGYGGIPVVQPNLYSLK